MGAPRRLTVLPSRRPNPSRSPVNQCVTCRKIKTLLSNQSLPPTCPPSGSLIAFKDLHRVCRINVAVRVLTDQHDRSQDRKLPDIAPLRG